jgi:hypothetical protein
MLFFFNHWLGNDWLLLNTLTGLLALGVLALMSLLYWGFKQIPYHKGSVWNGVHNVVAHLLNGPVALCLLLLVFLWGILSIPLGVLGWLWEQVFPPPPFDEQKAIKEYRKKIQDYLLSRQKKEEKSKKK